MKKLLFTLLTLTLAAPNYAQDLTAVSPEGVEIYFMILDENDKTCATIEDEAIDKSTVGKVTIPDEVEGYAVVGIASYSFEDCEDVTEVVLPHYLQWIDERAFWGAGIEQVTIGDVDGSYTEMPLEISDQAFWGCTRLKKLTLGDNVTTIGEHVFSACSALEALHIPASVEFIGSGAFRGLTACESITVDVANQKYEDKGCNALFEKGKGTVLTGCKNTNLNHPEITGIDVDAFRDIPITDIYIPANMQQIPSNPFVLCPLERITVDEANPYFDSRENCNAIIRKEGNVLQTGCKNTVIPSSVETIGYQSFQQVSGMTEMLIPEGVRVIEKYAVYVCPDLKKIVVPSTVCEMADKSFSYNPELEDVYSYIMEPFPISNFCFAKDEWHAFNYFDDVVLHVPKGTKGLYQQMEWWNLFLNIEEMDDNSEVTGMATDKAVASVKYHNLAGMVSDRPFDGVNIVTTTYTDGTATTSKVLR